MTVCFVFSGKMSDGAVAAVVDDDVDVLPNQRCYYRHLHFVVARTIDVLLPAQDFRIVCDDSHDRCNTCHIVDHEFSPNHMATHRPDSLPVISFGISKVAGPANVMCPYYDCKINDIFEFEFVSDCE